MTETNTKLPEAELERLKAERDYLWEEIIDLQYERERVSKTLADKLMRVHELRRIVG